MERNILGNAQRETSGATTFAKYHFQYHWALCKIIERHKANCDYALLIEYHEDVVIADSMDGSVAQFEFYQVKNKSAAYTPHGLTKRENGKTGKKSSILGKLLSSCIGTDYETRITEIGLVSSNGFSLEQRDSKLELEILTSGDLSENCLKELTDKLKDEIGIEVLPKHLKFIVPKIKIENQAEFVIGKFAELVDDIFPNSQCNAVSIYRAVIDEIGRKGQISHDFTLWETMIEKKSLTSHKVKSVISAHTSSPSFAEFENALNYLATNEMHWKTILFKVLKRKLKEMFLRRTGQASALDMNLIRLARMALQAVPMEDFTETSHYIEAVIVKAKELNIEKYLPDHNDILCEIIYSYIQDEE